MSEPTTGAVTLFPQWKQAVRDFLAAGFKPGDVVTHAWLEMHFGMEPLDVETPLLLEQYQQRQFDWLRNVEGLRTELLEQHQIFLSNVHGQGYRVVPPGEQTALAQERFEKEAARSYRKTANTLKNVRLSELTEGGRKENTDAVARLAMLRGMHRALE